MYPDDAYVSNVVGVESSPVIIVEFAPYTGPPLLDADTMARLEPHARAQGVKLARLCAISTVERRCDCKQCTRASLPLRCGKADCVHSLQGLSIGEGEAIQRVIFRWSKKAETIWPGAQARVLAC